MATIPFEERKTPLRGILDLAHGCYPSFLFGGRVGRLLPMFHFHEVSAEYLEPHLRHLAENGYRTITSDAVARFVRDGVDPGPKSVVLGFDDAWASVWTVAAPLLEKYSLKAITYVIPGLVEKATKTRPTVADGLPNAHEADRSVTPYATWAELKALHDGGVVDVQAHTFSHAMIFCSDTPAGFLSPTYAPHPLLKPVIDFGERPTTLEPSRLGAPLYPVRSRMSDAVRYEDSPDARRACCDQVAAKGGAAFFERPGWETELRELAGRYPGRFESPAAQREAILEELVKSREILQRRLKTDTVRQVCLPWAVMGRIAESLLNQAGFTTAVADRLYGKRAVCAGQNPWRLMRLKHKFVFCLPGIGRKWFLTAWKGARTET